MKRDAWDGRTYWSCKAVDIAAGVGWREIFQRVRLGQDFRNGDLSAQLRIMSGALAHVWTVA